MLSDEFYESMDADISTEHDLLVSHDAYHFA